MSTVLESRPDLRVAMLTASLGPEETSRARYAGAFAAFEKPASVGEWRQLLGQVVPAPPGYPSQPGPALA